MNSLDIFYMYMYMYIYIYIYNKSYSNYCCYHIFICTEGYNIVTFVY